MKSNAPFLVASTAVLIVPWPEITTTGSASFMRAQPLEHLEAVHAGHLDVEEHEVGRLALGQRQPFLAGRGAEDIRSPRTRGSSAASRGWPPRRR